MFTLVEAKTKNIRLETFEKNIEKAVQIEQANSNSESMWKRKTLLEHSQVLLKPETEDALTGVKWAGIEITPDYWQSRTYLMNVNEENPDSRDLLNAFKAKNKPLKRLKLSLTDQFAKSTQFKQGVMLIVGMLTTAVVVMSSIAFLGVKIKDGIHFFSHSSKDKPDTEIKITNDEDKKALKDTKTAITPSDSDEPQDQDPEKASEKDKDLFGFHAYHEVKRNIFGSLDTYTENIKLNKHELPRYLNNASFHDFEEKKSFVKLPDNVFVDSLPRRELDSSTVIEYFNDESYLIPKNGYLLLPRPEGYHLKLIRNLFSMTAKRKEDLIEAVHENSLNGHYLIQLKDEFKNETIQYITATFEKDEGLLQTEFQPVQDARLDKLDSLKLKPILEKVKAAHLNLLANDLEKLIKLSSESIVPVQILADVISSHEIYSLKPGGKTANFIEKWLNPYQAFHHYLRGDTLYFKCDAANSLLQTVLKDYFQAEKDIVIQPYYSYILDALKSNSQYLDGRVGTIGHERTLIRIHGKSGFQVWDATPFTTEFGFKMEAWEHQLSAIRRNDLELLKKDALAHQKKKSRPLHGSGGDDELFSEGTLPEELKYKDMPLIEGDPHFREKKIAELREKTKMMLNSSTFERLVYEKEIYPPQRIYIIARKLLRVLDNEMTYPEFLKEVLEYYPAVGISESSTSEQLSHDISLVLEYETQLWDKLQKISEKSRNSRFLWSENPSLKQSSLDLLDFMIRYQWFE